MKPLDPRRHDTLYVSRDGQVRRMVRPLDPNPNTAYCPMEYQGFEKDRGTLKFRRVTTRVTLALTAVLATALACCQANNTRKSTRCSRPPTARARDTSFTV